MTKACILEQYSWIKEALPIPYTSYNHTPIMNDSIFGDFKRSKLIGKSFGPTDMGYSTDGLLLGACNSSMLKLFSSIDGQVQNIIHIPDIAGFEFIYPNTLIHSRLNTLSYLSVYDNQYIRSFDGHKTNIRAISVSPRSDTLMSSSEECTNHWDIRKKRPTHRIEALSGLGALSSTHDLAIAVGNALLKIYDTRSARGPRTTVKLPIQDYNSVSYSPNGLHIVVSSNRSHFIFGADGSPRNSIGLEKPGRGCFTPDSKYFACSASDSVSVYRLEDTENVHAFQSPGFDNTIVRFNPRYAQVAAASSSINLWALPAV
jgi:COMPASS component SWD2